MTKEFAIALLKQDIQNSKQNISYRHNEVGIEALQLAIKALEQQTCEDCISRQRVLNDLENVAKGSEHPRQAFVFVDECVDYITSVPSVTPQPKTGYWIDNMDLGYHVSICSNCDWRGHGDTCLIYRPRYCPNCGTRMIDIKKSEDAE